MKSWSHSRYDVHAKCPYRAKLQYDDRIPVPSNPHADRGTMLHENAQAWVRDESEDLHEDLHHFTDELGNLRKLYSAGLVVIEKEWAWAEQFSVACDWASGWVRMKLDFYVNLGPDVGLVIDLKSGKKAGNEIKHTEQGQLYAVGAYLRNPSLQSVQVEFWYVDHNDTLKNTYTADQIVALLARWIDRGLQVTSGTYKPRPNIFSCKYCPFRLEEEGGNGACEYAVKTAKVVRKKSQGFFDFGKQ